MIKKITRFFLVFLTTGILFAGCPIEYSPFVEPPFVAPPGTVTVSAESPGYGAYQSGPNFPVSVTLYFSPEAVFLNVTKDIRHESANDPVQYPAMNASVNYWRTFVLRGVNIASRPPLPPVFPFNYVDHEYIRPWPPQYLEYFDAFAGATVTVNALTRAAISALNTLPPNFFN